MLCHNELIDILVHRLVRLITSSKDDSTPPQLSRCAHATDCACRGRRLRWTRWYVPRRSGADARGEGRKPPAASDGVARSSTCSLKKDRALTRDCGGSGLGVASAKHIVQRHGGPVWAESREGQHLQHVAAHCLSGSPACPPSRGWSGPTSRFAPIRPGVCLQFRAIPAQPGRCPSPGPADVPRVRR